jgi:hypothetical protein
VPRGKNPSSLNNLKPTKPGQVLNPQGINRKRPITDRYYQRSEEPLPEILRAKINASIGEELLKTRRDMGGRERAQPLAACPASFP